MRYSISLLLFASTLTSLAQGDSTSVYFKALSYYNDHLDKSKSQEKEIYIDINNGITDKLPDKIGQRNVLILSWENQKDIYVRNNNKIRHVKIFPARINADMIEVNFTPYIAEYKGKKKGKDQYFHGLSDWVIIQFKFNCVKNRFEYYATKTGGI